MNVGEFIKEFPVLSLFILVFIALICLPILLVYGVLRDFLSDSRLSKVQP